MAVPKVTALEFQDRIRRGITSRNSTHDTAFGPIPDIVINPVASVLEEQNDRLRLVSLLMSLANQQVFQDADVEAFVFNEGIVRSDGAQATGTVVFSKRSTPATNITIQRGFPIATAPDENNSNAITFVTTEAKTLTLGTGFNLLTSRYELEVPVIALVAGVDGIVGPGRINRPQQPLVEFDAVTNRSGTAGGRARETNDELILRYLISILGTQLGTPFGTERYIRNTFGAVEDVLIVGGTNPLLTRTAEDAGAVDAYIIGTQPVVTTENVIFLGTGQRMVVSKPPLISVQSFGSPAFIVDTDYSVVFDTSGVEGSERARDGVVFLATATTPPPAVGAAVPITYTYNQLIRNIQDDSTSIDANVEGRDLLVKQGLEIDIFLEATLTVLAGFNPSGPNGIQTFVQNALLAFVGTPGVAGGLGLGDPVQISDLQAVVRKLSGVDNFVVTRLVRQADLVGAVDLNIAGNEFARLPIANLRVTLS